MPRDATSRVSHLEREREKERERNRERKKKKKREGERERDRDRERGDKEIQRRIQKFGKGKERGKEHV